MLRTVIAAVLCAAVTVPPMQTKQIVNAGPAPVGPYSAAVNAGGLIYLSGTIAQDDKGALVGDGDAAAQTKRIIERMREVLKASGSSLEQVVAVTVYLRSASDFPVMNDTYKAFWPKDPPTRTTVITDLVLGADVEISMIAVPNGAERKVIHPADWVKSPNPYSYAIRTGDTLFLSGLVPRNGKDNTPVGGDIRAQTKAVMENAGQLLKAAGMDFTNLVSAKVYLPNAADFREMNNEYRRYFALPSTPPARATVKAGLAGAQYAVEMTFVASASPREPYAPVENLSGAVKAGNRIYLSGLLGHTSDTLGDVTAQTREVMSRIRKMLEVNGYTADHVVDAVVYLTDLTQFSKMNEEYRAVFGKDFPARATVGTGLMAEGAVVEIMVTAVKQ